MEKKLDSNNVQCEQIIDWFFSVVNGRIAGKSERKMITRHVVHVHLINTRPLYEYRKVQTIMQLNASKKAYPQLIKLKLGVKYEKGAKN